MIDPRCDYPGCDERADLWWKGPWCGYHADAQYGRVPMWVAANERNGGGQGLTLSSDPPAVPVTEAELAEIVGIEGFGWLDAEYALLNFLGEM